MYFSSLFFIIVLWNDIIILSHRCIHVSYFHVCIKWKYSKCSISYSILQYKELRRGWFDLTLSHLVNICELHKKKIMDYYSGHNFSNYIVENQSHLHWFKWKFKSPRWYHPSTDYFPSLGSLIILWHHCHILRSTSSRYT